MILMEYSNHSGLIKKLILSLSILLYLTTSIKTVELSDEKSEMQLLWEYDAGAKIYAAPVIVEKEGLVFFGNDKGDVYGIRLLDGMRIWRKNVEIPIKNEIAVDEQVYITAGSNILSLDIQTGDTNWEYKAQGQIVRAPTLGKERLYFESVNGEDSYIYSAYKKEGDKKAYIIGKSQGPYSILKHGEKCLVYTNDTLFLSFAMSAFNFKIVACEPNGIGLYSTSIPSFPSYGCVTDDKKLFVTLDKNKIWALDISNLSKIWSIKSIGSINLPPIIYKDKLVFYDDSGCIALHSTLDGRVLNRIKLDDQFIKSFTYAEPFLYWISIENRLSALDLTSGKTIWTKAFESEEVVSLKAAKDKFIVALNSGKLLCYKNIYYKESEISGEITKKVNSIVTVGEEPVRQRIRGTLEWRDKSYPEIIAKPAFLNDVLYVGDTKGFFRAIDERDGQEIWRFVTEGPIYTEALVHKEFLYFGSMDSSLYALDSHIGRKKWRYKTEGGIQVTPVINGNSLYFGSCDNYFYCLDADNGALKWRFKTGGPIKSTAFVVGKYVYFGNDDYNFYVLNKTSGKLDWTFKTKSRIKCIPSIKDGILVFGSFDGYLYALDAVNSREIWRLEINPLYSSPLIIDDTIYIGSEKGYLYSLDLHTGKIKWKFETNGGRVLVKPVLYNNTVFFTSEDGAIYGLDISNGNEIFKFDDDSAQFKQSTPLVKMGKIYIGSTARWFYSINLYSGKNLYLLNQDKNNIFTYFLMSDNRAICITKNGFILAKDKNTGNILWSTDIKSPVNIHPVLKENSLYIISDQNRYSIDINTGSSSWVVDNEERISSYTIKEDIIYAQTNDRNMICMIDIKTGKEIQKQQYLKTKAERMIPYMDKILLIGNRGMEAINCVDGKSIWNLDYDSSSKEALISNGFLYINLTIHSRKTLEALDINTGKVIWENAAYLTPLYISDHTLFAFDLSGKIFQCDADNGRILKTLDTKITAFTNILMNEKSIFIYSNDDKRVLIYDTKSGVQIWSESWNDIIKELDCIDAKVARDSMYLLFPDGSALIEGIPFDRLNFPDVSKNQWKDFHTVTQEEQPIKSPLDGKTKTMIEPYLKLLWAKKIENINYQYIQYLHQYLFVSIPNSKSYQSEAQDIIALRATDGKILWRFGLHNFAVVPPLIYKGKVYILERIGGMYALEKKKGKINWQFNFPIWINHSAPIIYKNFLYFGARDEKWPICAIDIINKNIYWQYEDIDGSSTPLIFNENKIYFGDYGGNLKCINAETGKINWKNSSGYLRTPPIKIGKYIYTVSEHGFISKFNKYSGKLIWQKSNSKSAASSLLYTDGKLFYSDENGMFYCLDATKGEELWRFKNDSPISHFQYDITETYMQTIWFYNSQIYFLAQNGSIYALNAKNGTLAMKYQIDSDFCTPPVIVGNKLYILNKNSHIYSYEIKLKKRAK